DSQLRQTTVSARGSAAALEKIPLGVGWRQRGGPGVGSGSLALTPKAPQQVGARGVERVVIVQVQLADQSQRSRRPSTSPTATARFSATTGVGATAINWSYRATICDQSVSSAVAASACTALIAACS